MTHYAELVGKRRKHPSFWHFITGDYDMQLEELYKVLSSNLLQFAKNLLRF